MRFLGILLVFGLASCAAHRPTVDLNESFVRTIKQVQLSPQSVPYDEFFAQYLMSDQVLNTREAHELYTKTQVEFGKNSSSCANYAWDQLIEMNVMAIAPQLMAIECLSAFEHEAKRARYENLVSYIITGILSSHSGSTVYDAYEIATWGDADDILQYAGIEVIDSYFEWKSSRAGLYRVYNVRDADSKKLSKIYFDNQRFLHRVIDIQYPFAGIGDSLYKNVIVALAESDYAAQHAKGLVEYAREHYEESEATFLKAIGQGSVSANLDLGRQCLSGHGQKFSRYECAQLFVTAAELGLEEAKVYLAFMALTGVGMDKDKTMAQQLLSSAEENMNPGEPDYLLALLFSEKAFGQRSLKLMQHYLERAVDKKNKAANYYLGLMLIYNDELKNQSNKYEQAQHYFEVAAEHGYAPAQFYLSLLLVEEESTQQQGLEWLAKAMEQNYPAAHYQFGQIYDYGSYGYSKDYNKALQHYRLGAYRWDDDSIKKIGNFYHWGRGVDKNYDLANTWYSLCARNGDATCLLHLGNMAEWGQGEAKDPQRANELYGYAIEAGSLRASFYLAKQYEEGAGVEKNFEKAFEIFYKGAEKGDSWCMNSVGLYYLEGRYVEVNIQNAKEWFLKAADKSNQYAFFNLGRMYQDGLGLEADLEVAIEYYKNASELGHAVAHLKLGEIYQSGQGSSVDYEKAYWYFMKAGSLGEPAGFQKAYFLCDKVKQCDLNAGKLLKSFQPKTE